MCNGSFHGEINGVDYCFAIFGKCNGSFIEKPCESYNDAPLPCIAEELMSDHVYLHVLY